MNKLLSVLIATTFAATLSFNAVADKHMAAAPASAPAATTTKADTMKGSVKTKVDTMKGSMKEPMMKEPMMKDSMPAK